MDQLSVEIAGQQIAYLDTADGLSSPGERTVIFVHGNSQSARTWLPLMTGSFGQRFHCLALDLPGHGQSAPARKQANYSLPGYADTLTGFARTLGAADSVFVGWSLGGQIILEAIPDLPDAAGFAIFGAPPVGSAAHMGDAFRPHPAMNTGFSSSVSAAEARAYASSFTAPGSDLDTSGFVADILATDGAARAGLMASVGAGRFADERAIVAGLRQPLAIIAGTEEQLVNLDYLRQLDIPALWRGEVQLIPGAGHAPQQEAPQQLAELLTDFIASLSG